MRFLEAVHFAGEDVFQLTYYLMATLSELQGEGLGYPKPLNLNPKS